MSESDSRWLTPWYPSSASHLLVELQRELSVGHTLYGLPVRVVAQRQDCDDVLFELCDETGRFVVVHLSYSAEIEPNWPKTEMFASFRAFAEKRMRLDHLEFGEDE